MQTKSTGFLAGLVVIFTLIWLAQMIGVSVVFGAMDRFDQALAFAQQAHWFYYSATYINALLLTLFNVLLYGSLYGLLKDEHPGWASAGLAFVPLYAILALFSYLSQLTVVPALIAQLDDPQLQPAATLVLQHMLQIWPQSTLMLFDQFSYFLLGFPGLIYGLLMGQNRQLRIPGALFAIGGAFCMPIGLGIVAHLPSLIGIPSMAGGVISIAATGWLAFSLLRGSGQAAVFGMANARR